MPVIADALKITPAAALTSSAAVTQSVFQTTAGGNLLLNAPGSNRLNAQTFFIQASGIIGTGAGTYTATIKPILYGDASLATVTTKPLFTAGAGTLAYTGTTGAAIPWTLFAQLEGDSTSGALWGNVETQVGATYTSPAVTSAVSSVINFATEPPLKFAIGVTTTGTLGASPKITINQFQITQE